MEVARPTEEQKPRPAPSAATEKLELVVTGGTMIRIPTDFDAEALRKLLAVVN